VTLLAVVFKDRNAALAGIHSLYDLEAHGCLEVNTVHVVRKDDEGTITEERAEDDFPPPSGTLAGLALGSLLGVLGGNVAAAAGAGVGAMIGLLRDLAESESHTEFVAAVANALTTGMYAVLADLTEHRPGDVDVRMRGLGGNLFRTTKRAVLHLHRAQRSAGLRAEADALTADLSGMHAHVEERLHTAIDRVQKLLKESPAERKARSIAHSPEARSK